MDLTTTDDMVSLFADGLFGHCLNRIMDKRGYGQFSTLEEMSLFLEHLPLHERNLILSEAVWVVDRINQHPDRVLH